ncbi:hypothetical protein QBC39DRAFT_64002 [Podospora conica]|nr:hypothetical protein QBC39DRAFT_64002 [Schizothecium conicum]
MLDEPTPALPPQNISPGLHSHMASRGIDPVPGGPLLHNMNMRWNVGSHSRQTSSGAIPLSQSYALNTTTRLDSSQTLNSTWEGGCRLQFPGSGTLNSAPTNAGRGGGLMLRDGWDSCPPLALMPRTSKKHHFGRRAAIPFNRHGHTQAIADGPTLSITIFKHQTLQHEASRWQRAIPDGPSQACPFPIKRDQTKAGYMSQSMAAGRAGLCRSAPCVTRPFRWTRPTALEEIGPWSRHKRKPCHSTCLFKLPNHPCRYAGHHLDICPKRR